MFGGDLGQLIMQCTPVIINPNIYPDIWNTTESIVPTVLQSSIGLGSYSEHLIFRTSCSGPLRF